MRDEGMGRAALPVAVIGGGPAGPAGAAHELTRPATGVCSGDTTESVASSGAATGCCGSPPTLAAGLGRRS